MLITNKQVIIILISAPFQSQNALKHWIFHFSHDKIASLHTFQKKVIDHYNYGLLLIVDSDSRNAKMGKRAVRNLRSVAEEIRDQMVISFCDIAKDPLCRDLVVKFELEDHDLPIIRVLFRQDSHHEDEVGQEEDFFKFALDTKHFGAEMTALRNEKSENGKNYYYVCNMV